MTAEAPERRVPRLALVIVLVAAVVAAVAADRLVDDEHERAPNASIVMDPVVPSPDAVSTAWYCAAGSSVPDAAVAEEIVIGNIGERPARAALTVYPIEPDVEPVTREIEVEPRTQARVPVSDVLASQSPGVIVEVTGGPAVVEHVLRGENDVAAGPCTTSPSTRWFFAAGSSLRDVRLTLSVFNPFADDSIVDITLFTVQEGKRAVTTPGQLNALVVPRRTKLDIQLSDLVQREDLIATQVKARSGRIVAEEVLARSGDAPSGLALSLGAPAVQRSWEFASGATLEGRSNILYLTNPGARAVEVDVETRVDGDTTLSPLRVAVPGRAVVPVDLDQRVPPGFTFATRVRVRGDGGIVAEMRQGWSDPADERGLATALGVPEAAPRWAFALGQVDDDGGGRIVVSNPGDGPLTASVIVLFDGREPPSSLDVAVDARRTATVDLDEFGVGPEAALVVRADGPVVVARVVANEAAATVSPGVLDP